MKTKKIVFAVFAAFVLLVCFFSCAHADVFGQLGTAVAQGLGYNPDPRLVDAIVNAGVAWGRAIEEITPEQEYFIGRAVAATVLGTYRIQTNNPDKTAYINKICNALIINSPRPEIFNSYHANILDSDEINAFATPGGHIFLTRGLVNCAASEDALAAVIAHEIAHIQLEHGLGAIKNSRGLQAIKDTAGVAVAASGYEVNELTGIFGDVVGEIVTTMMIRGYSREQEYDADSVAMALLSLAGYEPSSLIEMLKVLEREQAGRRGGFNSTHPTPAQRISSALGKVGNYDVPDTRSYRQARFAALR